MTPCIPSQRAAPSQSVLQFLQPLLIRKNPVRNGGELVVSLVHNSNTLLCGFLHLFEEIHGLTDPMP
jgi:hypothetical protein